MTQKQQMQPIEINARVTSTLYLSNCCHAPTILEFELTKTPQGLMPTFKDSFCTTCNKDCFYFLPAHAPDSSKTDLEKQQDYVASVEELNRCQTKANQIFQQIQSQKMTTTDQSTSKD